jgi:protein arginine kinase activator
MLSKAFSGQPTAISAEQGDKTASEKGSCPSCGWTLEDFRKTSRLGCPNDYDLFSDFVSGVLNRIHGYAQHPDISADTTIERLQDEMQEAVSREDYETASRLRDRIKELESSLGDDPVLD